MKTYIALLRGINVGGKNTVPMPALKALFEKLGFTHVRTYINSGNVVFSGKHKDLEKVEPAFEKEFGFPIRFLFVEKRKFQHIHDAIPDKWTNDAEHKTDVWFLWEGYAKKSTLKLLAIREAVDEVRYAHGAIIWHVPKKHFGKSGMNKVVGTDLYKHITVRNVNTVRKLFAFLEQH